MKRTEVRPRVPLPPGRSGSVKRRKWIRGTVPLKPQGRDFDRFTRRRGARLLPPVHCSLISGKRVPFFPLHGPRRASIESLPRMHGVQLATPRSRARASRDPQYADRRHCCLSTPISISTILSQLACFGVEWNSSRRANRRPSMGENCC